jgi:hypothetical protein
MTDSYGRGTPSGLRGWLSEVYFPALVSLQASQLAQRLGDRASVDDAMFGRASGMPGVGAQLEEMSKWLSSRDPAFERFGFVMGSDRDVTEGSLALTIDGQRLLIPVAIVAERRREREVELRSFYATSRLRPQSGPRRGGLAADDQIVLPPPVAAHVDALRRADVDAIVASFEHGGTVRGADGETHAKLDEGGPLRDYYARLLAGGGGLEVVKSARADDGSTCALEYNVVRIPGRTIAPEPGLAVYERGESGLLRTVRVYDDIRM